MGLIPLTIILVVIFYAFSRILQSIKDQQTKYLALIFDLINKVEKGEPIPSLNELEKKVDQKTSYSHLLSVSNLPSFLLIGRKK